LTLRLALTFVLRLTHALRFTLERAVRKPSY